MARVMVVTDSSACLPVELVTSLDISVLPISVYLPDEDDPKEHSGPAIEGLNEATAEIELSGANHPFVTEYLEAIEKPGFEAAVIITPAVEFAAMYRNAAVAASLARCPAVALDARTAAAGQALVVLAGAEEARSGASLDSVVRVIEDAARRVVVVASLGTLEPIRRSGPVPSNLLPEETPGSRSVFRMCNGTIEPLDTTETADAALQQIADTFSKSTENGAERIAVFHAEAPELAMRLCALLGRVDFVSGFSLAMQVHTGTGVVGAAWIPRVP